MDTAAVGALLRLQGLEASEIPEGTASASLRGNRAVQCIADAKLRHGDCPADFLSLLVRAAERSTDRTWKSTLSI